MTNKEYYESRVSNATKETTTAAFDCMFRDLRKQGGLSEAAKQSATIARVASEMFYGALIMQLESD